MCINKDKLYKKNRVLFQISSRMEALKFTFILSLLSFTIKCDFVSNREWSFKDLIDFQKRYTQSRTQDLQRQNICKVLVKSCLEGAQELVNGYLYQVEQKNLKKDEVNKMFENLKTIADEKKYDEIINKYEVIETSLMKHIDLNSKLNFYLHWTSPGSYSGEDEESRCSESDNVSDKVLEVLKDVNIMKEATKGINQSLLKFGSYINQQIVFNENFIDLVTELLKTNNKTNNVNQILTFLRAKTASQISLTRELHKSVSEKGIEVVHFLITSGKHFDQTKTILEEVLEFNDQAYAEVLRKSYNCSLTNLNNTFEFAQKFNMTGLNFIINDMENCGHSSDSISCVIA
jgi:hypothetical protein